MPGRILNRMRSPEELQAEGCEQIDDESCLFFFFLYDIHQDRKEIKGLKLQQMGFRLDSKKNF